MSVARKIAIAAGAATLAAGGVAGALDVPDVAEEKVGQELPASRDSHPTKDVHPGQAPTNEAEALDEEPVAAAEEEGDEGDGVGPVDNHGAAVSAVAHATPSGPGKGAIVSEVARSDAGKPEGHPGRGPKVDDGEDEEDSEGDEG